MGKKAKNPYRRPDAFTKAARAQGYPARSVFKLEEIDHRVRLLRPGQRVLDLGAAPGSWSLYTAKKIGPSGKLLAVDLAELSVALGPAAKVVQGDALSLSNEDLGLFAPYDVVLSDMAPATSGSKVSDQAPELNLFMGAVAVARAHLRPGGAFVGKLFMSDDFGQAREALRRIFREARTLRPVGIRSGSGEVYLVGLERKADGETREPKAGAPR